jgi:hypothetical protein
VAPPAAPTVSLSGGEVAAGSSCVISIGISAPSDGTFVNTTGDLESSLGNSGAASDTLTVNPCLAADGVELTLESDVVLTPEAYEVCRTVEIRQHFQVLGPSGVLTIRAGEAVVIFNGVEFGAGSEVSIEIDPTLVP